MFVLYEVMVTNISASVVIPNWNTASLIASDSKQSEAMLTSQCYWPKFTTCSVFRVLIHMHTYIYTRMYILCTFRLIITYTSMCANFPRKFKLLCVAKLINTHASVLAWLRLRRQYTTLISWQCLELGSMPFVWLLYIIRISFAKNIIVFNS